MAYSRKDLVGLEGLSRGELESLLDGADALFEAAGRAAGGDRRPRRTLLSVVNVFLEPSTRTRCSFELAEQRLGLERLSIDRTTSSLTKGETLADTGRTLAAMGINVIVLRHPENGAPRILAEALDRVHVINAGDGTNEHPTQGLLDLLTLRRHWGAIEGRTVVMVGDVRHSRVVRSNYHGLTTMGAAVVLCGPTHLLPEADAYPEAELVDDLDAALEEADAVMALRIQRERFTVGEEVPDTAAYRRRFGITAERADRLADDVPILHPGPMNRDVEIDAEVADGLRALVLRQVTAGVAVRMAVLSAMAEIHAGSGPGDVSG